MLLAMVTLVTTAGCGGSGEGGNSSAKTDNGNEGTNGAVEIEFWYGLGGILGETMEETIAEFNASQDEVVVKGVVQSSYDETSKMLQAAVASGEVPACYLGSHQTSTTFAEKGRCGVSG